MADDKKNIPDAGKVGNPPKPGKNEPVKADPPVQDQSAPAKAEAPVVEGASKVVTPPVVEQPAPAGRAVAHLLKHHIVPLFVLEGCLGLIAQPGVGVQLLRQPRPAPGVVDHLRPGQVSKHLRHIIGEGKTVAQHEDPHGTAPYSFISLLSTAIIHGLTERDKTGEV